MDITSRGRPVVLAALLASLVLALLPPAAASAEGRPGPDGPAAGVAAEDGVVPGRLLVGLEAGAAAAGLTTAIEAVGGEIVERLDDIDVVVVSVPEGDTRRAVEVLAGVAGVAYVEPDAVVSTSQTIPNDPHWPDQWGSVRTNLPSAWSSTVGSKDVVIAVLDTGVQSDHPDLKANMVAGRNVIAGDSNTADGSGHGTMSAGVAAAVGGNSIGIAGACWRCSIMPVKVMGDDGVGSTSHIAAGIKWAVDNGADIISMSFGTTGTVSPSSLSTLHTQIKNARDAGVLLIGAAGNDATTTPSYPAAFDEVVGTAASDRDDARYSFSNHGSWVDLAAPGCNPSTVAGGYTSSYCGTSSATPVVAGIAGLLLSHAADATADDVRTVLQETSRSRSYVRYGRVDAAEAITALAPVTSTPTAIVERLAGEGRIGTAIEVSKQTFPSADTVVLAYAGNFPDALAGAPLAKKLGAPMLLTGGGSLEDDVKDEITRLKASRVVVLGGTGAISEEVAKELDGAFPEVDRIAGADRYDTARKVAVEVLKGQSGTGRAYLVNGSTSWADAVAVSALAAQQGRPILLTTKDGLPTATLKALQDLDISELTVVGGDGVVAETVLDAVALLGIEVLRPFAGKNRYDTSAMIANVAKSTGAEPARTWLATGINFPDALAAGPAVAATGGILLLIDGTGLDGSKHTRDWLIDHADLLEHVRLVGGEGVISDGVRAEVEKIAGAK